MKIGIVGKGGVGKTTVAALVAAALRDRGRRVIAVDTDSNPNLGLSLGLSLAETEAIPELPRSLVVGRGDAAWSPDALLDTYGRPTPEGVTLLTAMRVQDAGAGCTCGSHATVRSLLGEVLDGRADDTIVDMEAGLEHLSRSGGTLAHADALVVVMEPSRKSVVTAARTVALAEELGIPACYGVGNKAQGEDDRAFFAAACQEYGVPLVAVLPRAEEIATADRAAAPVRPTDPALRDEIERLLTGVGVAPVAG